MPIVCLHGQAGVTETNDLKVISQTRQKWFDWKPHVAPNAGTECGIQRPHPDVKLAKEPVTEEVVFFRTPTVIYSYQERIVVTTYDKKYQKWIEKEICPPGDLTSFNPTWLRGDLHHPLIMKNYRVIWTGLKGEECALCNKPELRGFMNAKDGDVFALKLISDENHIKKFKETKNAELLKNCLDAGKGKENCGEWAQ